MNKPSWWKPELTMTGVVQLFGGLVAALALWFNMDTRISLLEVRAVENRETLTRLVESNIQMLQAVTRLNAILEERKKL